MAGTTGLKHSDRDRRPGIPKSASQRPAIARANFNQRASFEFIATSQSVTVNPRVPPPD